jgi:hypothetical protein
MADEKAAKKGKIDLKARLGRASQPGMGAPGATASAPGFGSVPPAADSRQGLPSAPPSSGASVIPPPSVPGSTRPSGMAPPPGLSSGIPLPPFGPQRPQPRAEPKPTAQAQTIKVEIGEEVEQERKKARRRTAIFAAIAALVGIFMGFVAGESSERGGRLRDAARGAALLERDVKAAGEKLRTLQAKVDEAAEKLAKKMFPDDFAATLSGTTIPFEASNLDNKGIGGQSPRLLKSVLAFTSAVDDCNKSRESLRNLVGLVKDPLLKAWDDEKSPKSAFSVLFHTEYGKGVVAELAPNKEPFVWKNDFPASYAVLKLEGGKSAEKKAARYQKGELPGNGSDPIAVPVDPKTTAGLTGELLIQRLNKAVYDLRVALDGNKDNPTNETPGLVKQADDLANELHKASLNQ